MKNTKCKMKNGIATAPTGPRNDGLSLRQLADRDDRGGVLGR